MTIVLRPDQEQLIAEMLAAGVARSPEEAIDQALRALSASTVPSPADQTARPGEPTNLADLFSQSPFRGLDLQIERDRDTGRDISL